MSLQKDTARKIEQVLKDSLRQKFTNHNPEPAAMPFHTRLLGKDRLALYSFIHSLNTNFGTTIFEPVARVLAEKNFKVTPSNVAGKLISGDAQLTIQKIMDDLTTASASPDKAKEIELIRRVCQKGGMRKVKLTKVDLMLENKKGEFFLFDLKTVKPNAGGFREFKRTLLEWVAVVLAVSPKATVNTMIAMPYNPYEPQPYNRWTMRGMLDLENELKVAEEFWDFLTGDNVYKDLLDCFEKVGLELKVEIDDYFSKFRKKH